MTIGCSGAIYVEEVEQDVRWNTVLDELACHGKGKDIIVFLSCRTVPKQDDTKL